MHYIPQNLKELRKSREWTQDQFARHLGVKRSLIGAYEEGRADPRISFLLLICEKFGLSMDQLVGSPLEGVDVQEQRASGSGLRILPIPVEKDSGDEKAVLVPVKAAAGYLNGYGDVEFIEALPSFSLPYKELSRDKTYRIFQVNGDSMLPVVSGSYIIGSYVEDWRNVKNDECYVVVSKSEGIVYKRLLNNFSEGYFAMKSDNPLFERFDLKIEDVVELWKAEGVTSFSLPESYNEEAQMQHELQEIKATLNALKEQLNGSKG